MAKDIAELVAAMRAHPADVRFAAESKVADHYFGEPRQQGTSHRIWKMPWPGDRRVNMQDDGGKAKAYQVEQLVKAIDRFEMQKAAEAATAKEKAPTKPQSERTKPEKKTKKRKK
jgi:hypothetical protein